MSGVSISKIFKGDRIIWLIFLLLSVISLLSVYSAVGTLAYMFNDGDAWYYVAKHFRFIVIGFVIILFVQKLNYQLLSKYAPVIMILAIVLLLITLIFGTARNEATRWLTIPGIGISFQTSDFAKFAVIIFVAKILSMSQKSDEKRKVAFFINVFVTGFVCLLIMFDNLSTSALLFICVLILMYIGRVHIKFILGLLALMLIGGSLIIALSYIYPESGRFGTWKNRIENYSKGGGAGNYQAEQAKMAIVTGGFLGKGMGGSELRNFLPQSYSDFIYSIIIEEYGILGGLLVLLLYIILMHRAGIIIVQCKKTFPAFLVIGLALSLVMQALVNMSVAVNLIPVTGQPLPLVSMGGTSILFTCFAIGLILGISRRVNTAKPVQEQVTA